jgi:hypothetical protein
MVDSSIILFALHIAGAAALLIWAVRLLRTGVERAFLVQLRAFLRRSNANRLQALISGVIAALCLQSATAVAVLLSNFATKGGVGLLAGTAILLGADIGSAIVSQILLIRQEFLIPLFLLCGVILFLRSSRNEIRQSGRILIGLGLVLVSLDMLRAATAPLIESTATAYVMGYLAGDLVSSFLIGGLFAWAVHSSVAAGSVLCHSHRARAFAGKRGGRHGSGGKWRRCDISLCAHAERLFDRTTRSHYKFGAAWRRCCAGPRDFVKKLRDLKLAGHRGSATDYQPTFGVQYRVGACLCAFLGLDCGCYA